MKQTFNKTQLNKALVEERKKMRAAAKQSLFMRRTLSIYNAQKARAKELKAPVVYTLESFRAWFDQKLVLGVCEYCGCGIRIPTLVAEHRQPIARNGYFSLDNLAGTCKPCNWQKGLMNEKEFLDFQEFLHGLGSLVSADIRRRLSLGGKWVSKL